MQLSKSVDNLCLYDPDFKYLADRFLAELGGSSDIYEVKTMDDLTAALNGYKSVKFLEIVLHGSPGTLYMGKMVMAGSYIANLAKTNPNLLQKNAQVLFDSCSIGKGESGDKFMNELGAGLLKGKGGVIGATTVDNWTFPLFSWTGVYMGPLSFGRLKVRKYDVDGRLDGSRQVDRHGISR
jgi:hypothetical protein